MRLDNETKPVDHHPYTKRVNILTVLVEICRGLKQVSYFHFNVINISIRQHALNC